MKEKTKQKLFVKRGGWILPGYLFDIKERGKNLDKSLVGACHPSYNGKCKQKDNGPGQPGKKT
jgi:hypothetical protein